jgi:hypothetical protein
MLPEDIEKRLSEHIGERKLPRKNKGDGRIINGKQDYLQMWEDHRKGKVLDSTT